MSVIINAKGTSTSTFVIGKAGTTVSQPGNITPPTGANLTIELNSNKYLVVDAGTSGPSLITASNSQDLHINPAVGGGQYLILNANRFPTVDGTAGQVLSTNGAGIMTWVTFAPAYQEFSATSSQTVFNTLVNTVSKAGGKSYLQIFVNGILQQEGTGKKFTVTGANQVTFGTGLVSGDVVILYSFG